MAASSEDRALVERFLRERSTNAFDRLYDAHAGPVFRFLLRLCGGDADRAEELAQESWVRAIAALGGFRGSSALRSWLIGIALNCWRETTRRRELPQLQLVPPAPAPDAAIDLERAICALAPGYREVLLLHDLEGHTHEEIAAALGIEVGSSKSQLARARRALREQLGSAWRMES